MVKLVTHTCCYSYVYQQLKTKPSSAILRRFLKAVWLLEFVRPCGNVELRQAAPGIKCRSIGLTEQTAAAEEKPQLKQLKEEGEWI